MFSIFKKSKKLKNVKRVCPKIKSKDKKIEKGQKNEKMNPHGNKKDHESVQVQMPLLFYFLYRNECVQLVIYDTIQGNQTV